MLNYFKKRRESKEELAAHLEEFKTKIKGIFDGWEITSWRAKKDSFLLSFHPSYFGYLRDEGEPFVELFTDEEQSLLWKEIQPLVAKARIREQEEQAMQKQQILNNISR